MVWLPDGNNFLKISICFDRIHKIVRQTGRRTDRLTDGHHTHTIARQKSSGSGGFALHPAVGDHSRFLRNSAAAGGARNPFSKPHLPLSTFQALGLVGSRGWP